MMKKGHKRKNWTERWFKLHLNYISYYVSEDLIEQKGNNNNIRVHTSGQYRFIYLFFFANAVMLSAILNGKTYNRSIVVRFSLHGQKHKTKVFYRRKSNSGL